jgi:hypothetical protein
MREDLRESRYHFPPRCIADALYRRVVVRHEHDHLAVHRCDKLDWLAPKHSVEASERDG